MIVVVIDGCSSSPCRVVNRALTEQTSVLIKESFLHFLVLVLIVRHAGDIG